MKGERKMKIKKICIIALIIVLISSLATSCFAVTEATEATNNSKITKEQLNEIAKQRFNISITKLSEGTIIFSTIQLAIVCSKDKKYKINERYNIYKKYMEDNKVKKVRNNFKTDKICFKSIPFLFIKNNRYKFLFFIFLIIPSKIINKII